MADILEAVVEYVDIDEIHGFFSPREFSRFEDWIQDQVVSGYATEVSVLSHYSGAMFRERWFKFYLNEEVWRLVYPDDPFHGCWEKVSDQNYQNND